jgi:predicted transcriptional regulator
MAATVAAARGGVLYRRVKLAREIAEMRARVDARGRSRPMTWRQIAKELGISEDTAQRYLRDGEQLAAPVVPNEVVEDAIALRERMLEELDEFWQANRDVHPSAAVGAMREMREVDAERMTLLQAIGKLPRNLTRWRAEADFNVIVREVLDVMEKDGVGEETLAKIHDVVRRHLPEQPDNVRSISTARAAR